MKTLTSAFNMYFFLLMALAGGLLFMHGVFVGGADWLNEIEQFHETALQTVVGIIAFALFFPCFLIMMVARHFKQRVERVEQLLATIEGESNM